MAAIDPLAARDFARDVVRQLRAAGFEAVWAGGCVRDQLLGRLPKDYDVATNATPDQIRVVFGRRKTLTIGAAFGVISVRGPSGAGQIEVATFRRDAQYSDGRHPDSVSFSTAEDDAQRRDFTVNGLFFDPVENRVIDYVGGQDDLRRRVVRAIRDPAERFEEDKLRMLRAVRFAATLEFELEARTLSAIQHQASALSIVSAERIAEELRRMLVHARRRRAVELLSQAGLLRVLLPEATDSGPSWQAMLEMLDVLSEPSFSVALAVLLRGVRASAAGDLDMEGVCRGWRLSNDEREGVGLCWEHESTLRQAPEVPWPRLQRVLILPRIEELLAYTKAVARVLDGQESAVEFCRQKVSLPANELNPLPLLTGDDLLRRGVPRGPDYRRLLTEVRDAQLLGTVTTKEQALELALRLAERPPE